jgi:hypothetical protein
MRSHHIFCGAKVMRPNEIDILIYPRSHGGCSAYAGNRDHFCNAHHFPPCDRIETDAQVVGVGLDAGMRGWNIAKHAREECKQPRNFVPGWFIPFTAGRPHRKGLSGCWQYIIKALAHLVSQQTRGGPGAVLQMLEPGSNLPKGCYYHFMGFIISSEHKM